MNPRHFSVLFSYPPSSYTKSLLPIMACVYYPGFLSKQNNQLITVSYPGTEGRLFTGARGTCQWLHHCGIWCPFLQQLLSVDSPSERGRVSRTLSHSWWNIGAYHIQVVFRQITAVVSWSVQWLSHIKKISFYCTSHHPLATTFFMHHHPP